MKTALAPTLLAVFLLAGGAPGRAQAGGQKVAPPPLSPPPDGPTGEAAVDRGRVEGGTYSNDFFGVSFSLPQGWVALDAAAMKAVNEEGRKVVEEGSTEKKKAALKASLDRTAVLLSVSKYDPAAPRPAFNANLLCFAERAPTAIVKTGNDYLEIMRRGYTNTGAKLEFVGPVRSERLGGVAFAAADVKVSAGPYVVMQKYYVTIMKRYALVFTFTYVDEDDMKTLEDALKSVQFK